jgi:hypothetical protein
VIQARADSTLPWGTPVIVPMPNTTTVYADVAPGAWEFQAIAVDIDDRQSVPVFTSIALAFDAPGPVTNFTAVEE